jgi:hypothetical protein
MLFYYFLNKTFAKRIIGTTSCAHHAPHVLVAHQRAAWAIYTAQHQAALLLLLL